MRRGKEIIKQLRSIDRNINPYKESLPSEDEREDTSGTLNFFNTNLAVHQLTKEVIKLAKMLDKLDRRLPKPIWIKRKNL